MTGTIKLTPSPVEFDAFVSGFIEALFHATLEEEDSFLVESYTPGDIDAESYAVIKDHALAFLVDRKAYKWIVKERVTGTTHLRKMAMAGANFAMARIGIADAFTTNVWPQYGGLLKMTAREFRPMLLAAGDDDRVHVRYPSTSHIHENPMPDEPPVVAYVDREIWDRKADKPGILRQEWAVVPLDMFTYDELKEALGPHWYDYCPGAAWALLHRYIRCGDVEPWTLHDVGAERRDAMERIDAKAIAVDPEMVAVQEDYRAQVERQRLEEEQKRQAAYDAEQRRYRRERSKSAFARMTQSERGKSIADRWQAFVERHNNDADRERMGNDAEFMRLYNLAGESETVPAKQKAIRDFLDYAELKYNPGRKRNLTADEYEAYLESLPLGTVLAVQVMRGYNFGEEYTLKRVIHQLHFSKLERIMWFDNAMGEGYTSHEIAKKIHTGEIRILANENRAEPRHNPGASSWHPTHEIHAHIGGYAQRFKVMLDDCSAYSKEEWETCSPADFERSPSGEWTFQGQPFDGEVYSL